MASITDGVFTPQLLRAGATSANSDTGADVAKKINENFLALATLLEEIEGKHFVRTANLVANNWESGVYDFTSDYPNDKYDIVIEPDGNTATEVQLRAWYDAMIVGNSSSNTIQAYGDVPTISIPIILLVLPK